MSSEKVDQAQLMRFLEIEKEIHGLERTNVLKNYEVRKKAADDVSESVQLKDDELKKLMESTVKEKDDVDKMNLKSIKDMFKDEASYNAKLSQEQEEYMEAIGKEESARQQFASLKKQHTELQAKADELKESAEYLKKLYDERDSLLCDIFGGEYGSDLENMLEAKYDSLMDRKQRVSVAKYKWSQARVLLQTAVNQMNHAVKKWTELKAIHPQNMQVKYASATDVRNNLIAGMQNVQSTQRYLSTIEFPYCKPPEMETLNRAINNIYTGNGTGRRHITKMAMRQKYYVCTEVRNHLIAAIQNVRSCNVYLGEKIEFPYCKQDELETLQKATNNTYTDMADNGRHEHACQCYNVTYKRAAALLQWFDHVIKDTILKDLDSVSKEAKDVEQKLRAERIRLIREKISENGGDVSAINDAGLKGMTDQTQLSDEDMDMKGVGITRPAPVDTDHNIPDAQMQEPCAPTPLPLSEIAPLPSDADLFGDISELKERHKKEEEEFQKAQDLNRARMQQGLQNKLAQRRHRKS